MKKFRGRKLSLFGLMFAAFSLGQSLVAFSDEGAPNLGNPSTPPKLTREQLTPRQQEILDEGPILDGPYVTGGVLGSLFGFGIGHAIQGRYGQRGWIFTLSEVAGVGLLASGSNNCINTYNSSNYYQNNCSPSAAFVVGELILVGFRIWEIVDLWATPPAMNAKYRRLKKKLGEDPHEGEDDDASWGVVPVASLNNKLSTQGGSSPGYGLGLVLSF